MSKAKKHPVYLTAHQIKELWYHLDAAAYLLEDEHPDEPLVQVLRGAKDAMQEAEDAIKAARKKGGSQ